MKKKTLASIFAFTAVATTVGTGVMSQTAVAKDNSNSNEVLLAQNNGNNNEQKNTQTTNSNQATATTQNTESSQKIGTAVIINGDGSLVLMGSNTVKSNLVGYLSAGEMVTVQGEDGGWYKVTVQETGASGYIKAANLQFIESGVNDPLSILKGNGKVINVSSNLRIRSAATMESNTVGHLLNGNSFKIIGKEGQWYKISANGVIGFIYSDYVAPSIINAVNSNSGVTNDSSSSSKVISTVSKASITGSTMSKNTTETSNDKVHSSASTIAASTNTKVSATASSNAIASSNKNDASATANSNSHVNNGKDAVASATATASSETGASSTVKNSGNKTETNNTNTNKNTNFTNKNENVVVNNNSKLYNDIYNIVKANFWTSPNTEGSTMSMDMSQTYSKDGVNYYSVYVHITNASQGTAKTTHYYISVNGNILNSDAFTKINNESNNKLTTSQIKEAVSQVANEYLDGQVNSSNLVYNISVNNSKVDNGATYYAVEVYNGTINSDNYISTIYVSPNGQVLGNLSQSENNNQGKATSNSQKHQIVKRTRSTADVVNLVK